MPQKSQPIYSIVFENKPDDFIADVITIIIIIIIALRHGVRVKLYRLSGSCRRRALRKRIFTKYTVVAAAAVVENQTKQQSTPLVTGTSRFCGHSVDGARGTPPPIGMKASNRPTDERA